MEAVVASAPGVLPEALAVTDRLAAADDDLASLARATRALAGLVSYGTSRGGDAGATEVIAALCARAFGRAVLRIAGACVGDDEAVAPAREAIRVLHEVALGGGAGARHVDRELYLRTVRPLIDDDHLHAACAGQLAGLLYLAEQLGEDEVTALIERRVSDRAAPAAAAAFVEGFLSVNALVLVKNRHVVAALDRFIQGIPADRFREVLPLLRRALAGLGATERRYLVENLLGHRQLGAQPQAVAALAARDVAALTAASTDLAAAMDDLDDLL